MTPASTPAPPAAPSASMSIATSRPAVRIGRRSALVLTTASIAGVMTLIYPLLIPTSPEGFQRTHDVPFIFMAIVPVLILVVLAELSEGGMDSKALAMLGVLSAINAALRPLGAGIAGIEMVFFMLVIAGRVFGPGFGFVLGCTSLFASALLTAGVGPWLPFQMLCAAWIGLGAGLLPRGIRGRAEIVMLAAYGVFAAYFFGFLMNLSFWPFVAGSGEGPLSYVPGASIGENLTRFVKFTLASSALTWDTGRAITNAVAIILLGPALLATFRRAARKASFSAAPTFGEGRATSGSTEGAVKLVG